MDNERHVLDSKDHYVDCTNDECTWRGLHSECYALGEIEPLCPECKDTTEPTQVY